MSQRIRKLFSEIHARYDFMNHLLSLGVDSSWRRSAAKAALLEKQSYKILDIGTGTADFAISMAEFAEKHGKKIRITGIDINPDMLRLGREKLSKKGIANVELQSGDGLRARYPDRSFDLITSAFILRNLDSLDVFAKENNRLLMKNGRFVHLDMAKPDSLAGTVFFSLYSKFMLFAGSFINYNAYSWLVHSIWNFDKKRFCSIMEANGFGDVRIHNLPTGIAFIVTGIKRKNIT